MAKQVPPPAVGGEVAAAPTVKKKRVTVAVTVAATAAVTVTVAATVSVSLSL